MICAHHEAVAMPAMRKGSDTSNGIGSPKIRVAAKDIIMAEKALARVKELEEELM